MSVGGALDTNVLERLIVQDDESQALIVSRLLEQHTRRSESLWVAVRGRFVFGAISPGRKFSTGVGVVR